MSQSSLKVIYGAPLEDADQNQIDIWLADLRQHEQKLKQKRNELSSIYQLPDEIFLQIFLEYRNMSDTISWTCITHVCRRWRAISVSWPPLWSRIAFTSAGWVQASFERSFNSLISITVPPECRAPTVSRTILSELHRVQSLHISCGDSGLDSGRYVARVSLSALSAPVLDTLALERDRTLPGSDPIALNDTFLSAGTPKLRRVRLQGWSLPWTSPILRNLTSLTLVTPPLPRPASLSQAALSTSLSKFLDLLESNPGLRQLTVSAPLPQTWAIGGKHVALRHLESFTFNASFSHHTALFNHISLPQCTTIHLSFNPPHSEAITGLEDLKTIVHDLAASLSCAWAKTPLKSCTADDEDGTANTGPTHLAVFTTRDDLDALDRSGIEVVFNEEEAWKPDSDSRELRLEFIPPFAHLLTHLLSTPLLKSVEHLCTTRIDNSTLSQLDATQPRLKSLALPCLYLWELLDYALPKPACLPSLQKMKILDPANPPFRRPWQNKGEATLEQAFDDFMKPRKVTGKGVADPTLRPQGEDLEGLKSQDRTVDTNGIRTKRSREDDR